MESPPVPIQQAVNWKVDCSRQGKHCRKASRNRYSVLFSTRGERHGVILPAALFVSDSVIICWILQPLVLETYRPFLIPIVGKLFPGDCRIFAVDVPRRFYVRDSGPKYMHRSRLHFAGYVLIDSHDQRRRFGREFPKAVARSLRDMRS